MEAGRQVITLVEKQKKNKRRYNIFINDAFAFSVHEDVMIKHRLLKGEEIDQGRIAEAIRDDERHYAYLEAIRYIGRRPRSRQETQVHLKRKGFEAAHIADVVRELEEQRYLDDSQLAKLWSEHRVISQKKGRKLVEMELAQKGLSSDHIREALAGIDGEEEYRAACELGRKKWAVAAGAELERKRKVMAYLLRRGFPNDLVNRVLRHVASSERDNTGDD